MSVPSSGVLDASSELAGAQRANMAERQRAEGRQSQSSPNISRLPTELLDRILMHVMDNEISDFARLRCRLLTLELVCKAWQAASDRLERCRCVIRGEQGARGIAERIRKGRMLPHDLKKLSIELFNSSSVVYDPSSDIRAVMGSIMTVIQDFDRVTDLTLYCPVQYRSEEAQRQCCNEMLSQLPRLRTLPCVKRMALLEAPRPQAKLGSDWQGRVVAASTIKLFRLIDRCTSLEALVFGLTSNAHEAQTMDFLGDTRSDRPWSCFATLRHLTASSECLFASSVWADWTANAKQDIAISIVSQGASGGYVPNLRRGPLHNGEVLDENVTVLRVERLLLSMPPSGKRKEPLRALRLFQANETHVGGGPVQNCLVYLLPAFANLIHMSLGDLYQPDRRLGTSPELLLRPAASADFLCAVIDGMSAGLQELSVGPRTWEQLGLPVQQQLTERAHKRGIVLSMQPPNAIRPPWIDRVS